MEPVVNEIAQEFEHDLKVIKVNIDEQPALAGRYGIQAIPSMLLFENGEVADRIVGLAPKNVIVQRLKVLLRLS